MAKCTVVSLLPWTLYEEKPGQFPGRYFIEKAPKYGSFGVTHVEEAYFLELPPDEKAPPRKIPVLAKHVAESLVEDFVRAQLATSYDVVEVDGKSVQALPGLFWLEEKWDESEIKKSHGTKLSQSHLNQTYWFGRLVKLADDDWARYGRHNVISDMQRAACKWLGLERPWNFDALKPSEVAKCPGCFSPVHPQAAICANCRTITNMEAYKRLQIAPEPSSSNKKEPVIP